jgi:hypothetical protein
MQRATASKPVARSPAVVRSIVLMFRRAPMGDPELYMHFGRFSKRVITEVDRRIAELELR